MIQIEHIGDRSIVIGGLGRMLYEAGIPIGILAAKAQELGHEVSWLHITDELIKHGWKATTIYNRIKEECQDSMVPIDMDKIHDFIHATYEDQRQMIFDYLFGTEEIARTWFMNLKNVQP